MNQWLEDSMYDLTEELEDYLLSRGVFREEIENVGFRSWCPETPSPSPSFSKRYGAMGENLEGYLVTPLRSPRNQVIGMECRSIDGKKSILRVLADNSSWNPIWLGLGSREMVRLWNGYDLWIAEGIFDVTTLRPLLPHSVVLGSLRANLTLKHLNFIQRFVKGTVYVVYDNDETGQRAMYGHFDENGRRQQGVVEKIRKRGLHCVPVRFKGGKDPNEIWEQGGYPAVERSFSTYL